jgi:hypothetical protein
MMHLSFLPTIIFLRSVLSHTWVEQLTVINSSDGEFSGSNGYPRGYTPRSAPSFYDNLMVYLIPSLESGRIRINDYDLVCASSQRTANQTENFSRLKVIPGSYVAIKYLENGHVTLPQNQPGKPQGAGTVYVFGTSQPATGELLSQVLQWTPDGSGGDKRGKLVSVQTFDDNRCYQINSGVISTARQNKYPNPIPGQPGSVHEQWCETDIKIPADVPANSTYTIYWVWQWPTQPGVPGLPDGKDEYYTTCSDLDVISSPVSVEPLYQLLNQDPQISAVPNFQNRATNSVSLNRYLT